MMSVDVATAAADPAHGRVRAGEIVGVEAARLEQCHRQRVAHGQRGRGVLEVGARSRGQASAGR